MRKNKINVFLIATLFICSMFSITGCQKEEVYIPVTVDTIEILEDGREKAALPGAARLPGKAETLG